MRSQFNDRRGAQNVHQPKGEGHMFGPGRRCLTLGRPEHAPPKNRREIISLDRYGVIQKCFGVPSMGSLFFQGFNSLSTPNGPAVPTQISHSNPHRNRDKLRRVSNCAV